MKKIDLFLGAMKSQSYRRPQWLRAAFAIVDEDRTKALADPFPYRIFQTPSANFAMVPGSSELELITDAPGGQTIFKDGDVVILTAAMGIPGIKSDTETTYYRWLLNEVCLFYPFGSLFGFINRRFLVEEIEDLILPLFSNDPEEGKEKDKGRVYIDDYIKLEQSVRFLEQSMHLFTAAGTRKTITCSKDFIALKKKLFAENKDHINDPAVLAQIATQLEAHDRAWMKGDAGTDILLDKKDFGVVRRKMYGFQGGEAGFDDGSSVVAVEQSLQEGWDMDKFPSLIDSQRVGSYNRGFQTAMGGDGFKKLIRATSNCQITKQDCGTKLGNLVLLNKMNYTDYIGLFVQTQNGVVLLSEETISKFLDKMVIIRSPAFCSFSLTDYCATCSGTRLSANPTGLSSATSRVGNTFMYMYMKAAHGKAIVTTDYDFEDQLF